VITAVPINPDDTYGNSFPDLEPYMLYGDRSAAGSSLERKDSIVQDLEYLQGMYPGHMKRLQEYVVSACDHLDYKNSPMYDEFPDRMMINQICEQIRKGGILMDEITEGAEYEEPTAAKQELGPWGSRGTWSHRPDGILDGIINVLLLHEMHRRRCRRRFCR
jgi:hypothetical protein